VEENQISLQVKSGSRNTTSKDETTFVSNCKKELSERPSQFAEIQPKKNELIPGLTLFLPSREESEWKHICIIHESCQRCNIFIEFVSDDNTEILPTGEIYYCCLLYIKSIEISKGRGLSKKEAKHDAARLGVDRLKENQQIIYKSDINHDSLETVEKGQLVRRSYETAPKLDDSNLGNKLLRKMGWKGSGGIGKNEGGISDPVFVDAADGRKGVGHEFRNRDIKRESVEKTLLDFIRNDEQTEIRFSNDLSSEERALVHTRCQKFGLKHKSHGKGDDRYLVVSKKFKI